MDLVCSWHRDPVVSWFKPCYLLCAVCMSSFACVGFLHVLQLPKVNVNFKWNSNPQPLVFTSLAKTCCAHSIRISNEIHVGLSGGFVSWTHAHKMTSFVHMTATGTPALPFYGLYSLLPAVCVHSHSRKSSCTDVKVLVHTQPSGVTNRLV